ncbi:MAG: hypothetical protein WD079_02400 [Phycisphaeraceae bacterium]
MKKNAENAAKLTKLLKKLKQSAEAEPVPERTALEHLIYAFLAWNTTRNQADQAMGKLKRATVDLNDLRVTDPIEIAEILGTRYSKAEERAERLVMVLRGVYQLEHGMVTKTLSAMPKREARTKLEELPGVVPFVSASVLLYGLGAHAIPVDDQLVTKLRSDGVVEEDATVEQVQSFLEQNIRAGDGLEAAQLLRVYAEAKVTLADSTKPGKKTSKAGSGRTAAKTGTSKPKTTKTTTKKKTTAKR